MVAEINASFELVIFICVVSHVSAIFISCTGQKSMLKLRQQWYCALPSKALLSLSLQIPRKDAPVVVAMKMTVEANTRQVRQKPLSTYWITWLIV